MMIDRIVLSVATISKNGLSGRAGTRNTVLSVGRELVSG